jgi:hypothetical protein
MSTRVSSSFSSFGVIDDDSTDDNEGSRVPPPPAAFAFAILNAGEPALSSAQSAFTHL